MIGLITINDYANLGNRLQNYAMYHILNKYDTTYNLVRLYGCETKGFYPEIKVSKFRKLYSKAKNLVKIIVRKKPFIYERSRGKNFLAFNQNIKNGETLSYDTDYSALNQKYDYFVTGSDQVWNPTFRGNGMYLNMLGFASASKKVAVSPSISVDSLTPEQAAEFKKYLSDFKSLSCREEQGAKLVSDLTGRECLSLLDPTLMLSPEEWDAVARKPSCFHEKKPYLLLYFLGEITPSYQTMIQQIAQEQNLTIINVYDRNSKYYSCGPAEFIWMIKHSTLVLTDSFHGSVFSFLYGKPFKIFKRQDDLVSMDSRMSNLIAKLHLENVLVEKEIKRDTLFLVNDKTYLLEEQKKFNDFLSHAFGKE